ncbi:hypothetical protein [Burkholderia pyrrocinia]|uniref:hypothetical protein n=1 Tax=Burkholderia pyrrocinia TaxID=60550 RepID=UPI0013751CF2|nr:hypothetical protein [Burkholderia pyrrocinia]
MNAVSNARQTKKDPGSADERRGGGQHTPTPTHTRAAKATSRETRRRQERGASGPVTTSGGDAAGKPLWEDDGGALPPEEWS